MVMRENYLNDPLVCINESPRHLAGRLVQKPVVLYLYLPCLHQGDPEHGAAEQDEH